MGLGWYKKWIRDKDSKAFCLQVGFKLHQKRRREEVVGRGDRKKSEKEFDGGMERRSKSSVSGTFGAKEGRKEVPSGGQPKGFEQGLGSEKSEIRSSSSYPPLPSTRRLDGDFRHKGRLSSFKNKEKLLGSSRHRVERKEICEHSTPFWSGNKSVYFHKGSESNGEIPERKRNKNFFLYRRLSVVKSIERRTSKGQKSGGRDFGNVGLDQSNRKGVLGTIARGRVSGSGIRHKGSKSKSRRGEDGLNVKICKDGGNLEGCYKKNFVSNGRKTSQHSDGLHSSEVCSKSIVRQSGNARKKNAILVVEEKSNSYRISEGKSGMVLKGGTQMERKKLYKPGVNISSQFGYRFFPKNVWSSSRGSDTSRRMELRETKEPYQHKRTRDYFVGNGGIWRQSTRKETPNKNRQSNSFIIRLESRRKERKLKLISKKDMEVCLRKEHYSPKTLLDKFKRPLFRRWFKQRAESSGVGTKSRGIQADRREIRKNGSRSLCIRQEQKVRSFQCSNKRTGERSRSNRLFHTRLARCSKLRTLSFSVDRKSTQTYRGMQSNSNNSRTELEGTTLVDKVGAIDKRKTGINISARMLWGEQREHRTVKKPKLDFQCKKNSLLNEAWQVIGDSWAKGTKERYLRSWKKFEKWLKIRNKALFPIQLVDFLEYLLILRETAPSEVRITVEVLKWIEKLNGLKDLVSESELVRRFVEGVERERKKRKKVEPFPVEILKHHLTERQEDLNWLKEALVVGLCLRFTWRTETIRAIKLNQVELVKKDRGEMFKITVLKSKTNQKGEEKTYWLDASSNQRYCLVRLLKEYLETSFGKNWKRSNGYLFVSKKGKQLTTSIVSEILNRMARRAGVEKRFSSKSLRIGAVEWMVRKGLTFETIRSLGWAENSPALSAYIRVTEMAVKGGSEKMFN